MSAASFDPRIRAYFGDDMLRAGFVPLPHLFLRHYRKLGLSNLQAMFVLQLIEIVWDLGDAPSSVTRLAERLGVDRRTVQICAKELQALGFVEVFDQWDESGGQVENGYDLSSLFRRIAAVDEQPAARTLVRRSRTTNDQRPATNDQRPTTNDPRPTTNDRGIAASGKRAATLEIEGLAATERHAAPVRSSDRTTQGSLDQTTPRSVDRGGVDAEIAPPVVAGSGLNRIKNKTKIQQEPKRKQQQAAASQSATHPANEPVVVVEPQEQTDSACAANKPVEPQKRTKAAHAASKPVEPQKQTKAAHAASKPNRGATAQAPQLTRQSAGRPQHQTTAPTASNSAHSLRWNVALGDEDVARSRAILERCGLQGQALAAAATTLDPAEAWALRLYARAARLTPAWIARQVYDFRTKQAKTLELAAHYDDTGRRFAALDAEDAETLCDLLDRACPMQAASVVQTVQAALGDAAAVRAALDAGWSLMAEQRGGPLRLLAAPPPSIIGEASVTQSPALWQRVLARLERDVAADAFGTWLSRTVLLEHDRTLIVIGTPNIFVRDEVDTAYRPAIERALAAELGYGVTLEVVIGSVAQVFG